MMKMNWKIASMLAFLGAVACLVWLISMRSFFGAGPVTITIQIAAAGLMIWARLQFGLRSFHATANPTAGGLVTRGPYRFLRHPIYAAVVYFVWAGVAGHPSATAILAAMLATVCLGVRMRAEEILLMREYPDYAAYSRRTARVLPFLF